MSKRPGDPGYAAGWCIHYRYQRNVKSDEATCEAGVKYSTFPKYSQRPCYLTDKGESKPDALPCEHLRRPTPEEIVLHEQWLNERMNTMGIVMEGIHDWRQKNKGRSHQEVVTCTVCQGRLHLSIAAYNGHVHVRCETVGCVSWVE